MTTCPECSSDGPFYVMERLVQSEARRAWPFFWRRRLVLWVAGALLSCQGCGAMFCAGTKGRVKRSPDALPYLPNASEPEPGYPPRIVREEPSDLPPPRSPAQIPLDRPADSF